MAADQVQEPEDEPDTDDEPDDSGGCPNGCVGEDNMMVVRDLNLDYPWKGGNQYKRMCPDCGSVQFTARTYWEMAEPKFVIQKGEDKPKPMFTCPWEDCDGELVGTPEECDECGNPLEWEEN